MRIPEQNLELAEKSSDNPLLDRFLEIMVPYWNHREKRMREFKETGVFSRMSEYELDLSPFSKRFELVTQYAWAVPTDEALDTIARHSPQGVVEIGAGTGYWASLLRARGVPVAAYDRDPYKNHQAAAKHSEVQVGGPKKASEWPSRTLFLCWPPYDTPFAHSALRYYKGTTLVYVGEGAGGATADDAFHDKLESAWELVEEVAIPQWEGIHDWLQVHRRLGT